MTPAKIPEGFRGEIEALVVLLANVTRNSKSSGIDTRINDAFAPLLPKEFLFGSPANSVDDAISLIGGVMPGWGFFLRRDNGGCGAGLVHPKFSHVTPCGVEAATPALALCLALVRAWLYQGSTP